MDRIESFKVNHNYIVPGIYISRIDGDIVTYDLRTRKPNNEENDYMDNTTMHSFEHQFATYIRNSDIGDKVIYFGPMGCQTGFYLVTQRMSNKEISRHIIETLHKIANHTGDVFGQSKVECGNYKNLDNQKAVCEAKRYLDVLLENYNKYHNIISIYPT